MGEAATSQWDADTAVAVLCEFGDNYYAVPVDRVRRIIPSPSLMPLPHAPPTVAGAIGVSGSVVPVIGMRVGGDTSTAPENSRANLVLVEIGGHPYAFRVDRVLQVAEYDRAAANAWRGRPVHWLDVDRIGVETWIHRENATSTPGSLGAIAAPEPPPVARKDAATLAVEAGGASHLLWLAEVVEILGEIPIIPVPHMAPVLAGLTIHRGQAIPVLRLDRIAGGNAKGSEDRHGFVLVSLRGRLLVLAVDRVHGLVRDRAAAEPLDLPPLLDRMLPGGLAALPAMAPAATPTETTPAGDARWLLVKIGGRRYALPADAIERVLADCPSSRLPVATSILAAVGVVEGRLLPIIAARAVLDLDATDSPAVAHVVVAVPGTQPFLLAVDAVSHIVRIPDAALRPLDGDGPISAIAHLEGDAIRVLAPARLLARAGQMQDAA